MISAEQITYGYAKSSLVLNNVDARPREGVMTALTGPSGRGKSTLLFVLGLMLRPHLGTVRIDGIDTATLSDADRSRLRAQHIGFVFQDSALDPSRGVLDNVIESTEFTGRSRTDARTRATELLHEMGVDVPTNRKSIHLSGGQAQRVALCRALLPAPSIVLADEPTGNLDENSSTIVLDRLRQEAQAGATVVIATHDQRVLARCDDVLEL